jgi:hypothetical protein
VNDPLAVGVVDGPGQCPHQLGSFARRLRQVAKLFGQGAAVHVFQSEVGATVVLTDFVDLHDMGVLEPSDDFGLAPEPAAVVGRGIGAGQNHL